ncbi:20967_t:CDS:2, partial [Cetraspora pellucida]
TLSDISKLEITSIETEENSVLDFKNLTFKGPFIILKECGMKYYLVEKDLLLREPPIFHSFYTKYENDIIYLCFNKEEY